MVFITPDWRPRRSVLFVPASNLRAIGKSASLPADAVIFDLEDSVSAGEQDAARTNLVERVASGDFGRRERIVRVSAVGGPDFAGDFAAALACAPDAILLPKVEDARTIAAVAPLLGDSPTRLWAMIESPRAIVDVAGIAGADPRLQCLVVGPNDLAKSTGVAMRPGRAAMVPWFMAVVAAARAGGLAVLDGVYNNFRDTEGFAAECMQGAELGFDGKTLIHPAQIEPANRAFSPAPDELDRARRIVAAYEDPANTGRGAISLDGEMIEPLHLESARQLLRALEQLGL